MTLFFCVFLTIGALVVGALLFFAYSSATSERQKTCVKTEGASAFVLLASIFSFFFVDFEKEEAIPIAVVLIAICFVSFVVFAYALAESRPTREEFVATLRDETPKHEEDLPTFKEYKIWQAERPDLKTWQEYKEWKSSIEEDRTNADGGDA